MARPSLQTLQPHLPAWLGKQLQGKTATSPGDRRDSKSPASKSSTQPRVAHRAHFSLCAAPTAYQHQKVSWHTQQDVHQDGAKQNETARARLGFGENSRQRRHKCLPHCRKPGSYRKGRRWGPRSGALGRLTQWSREERARKTLKIVGKDEQMEQRSWGAVHPSSCLCHSLSCE